MPLVYYHIGAHAFGEVPHAFLVDSLPVTVRKILLLSPFPADSIVHFLSSDGYSFILKLDEEVPLSPDGSITMKVSKCIGGEQEELYKVQNHVYARIPDVYVKKTSHSWDRSEEKNRGDRGIYDGDAVRRNSETPSSMPMLSNAVKGLGSFLFKAASSLIDSGETPSPTAMMTLDKLSSLVSSRVEGHRDIDLLNKLWGNSFGSTPLEIVSHKWHEIGFQNAKGDCTSDFRGGGKLSLVALVHLSDKYNLQWKASRLTGFPLALTGINLTFMLAEILQLYERKFESSQQVFWEAFAREETFYTFFCACFLLFQYVWKERKATIMHFDTVMSETRSLIFEVLKRGPRSHEELFSFMKEKSILFIGS